MSHRQTVLKKIVKQTKLLVKYDMAWRFQALSHGLEIPTGITHAAAINTTMTAAVLGWS